MAQTGFTPISNYYSATATNVPTAGNLVAGELAINTADGKLFYKDSSGVVQTLATKDATSGSFTNLAYTGTLTGGTGVVNLGSGQVYKDASGNVGIGVTPNAWTLGKSVSVGDVGSAVFGFGGYSALTSGTYFNSGWRYSNSTNKPTLFAGADGVFNWNSAAAGTAGNTYTLVQTLGLELNKSLALQGSTSQTGTGITFPATQSASSDANTLDDYEEGTWTPTISYTTSDGNLSYSTQVGRYTKVGNIVTITGQVTFSETTASGNVRIASLPFTSVNVSNYRSAGGVYFDNMAAILNAGYGRIAENSTLFVMIYADTGGGSALTATQTGAGSNIQFSITYQV